MSAAATGVPRDGTTNEQSSVVLLLVDVINDFDFPEAPQLFQHALPAARKIAALKKRLRAKGIPAVYVNDNFGRWRSDFRTQVERCLGEDSKGAPVARLLIPAENDYFVLKPKHSGFYASSLDVLLKNLGARKLIITGFAADICVLFTANDAYMRDRSHRAGGLHRVGDAGGEAPGVRGDAALPARGDPSLEQAAGVATARPCGSR